MSEKLKQFNVMFSKQEHRSLSELAKTTHLTKSSILRQVLFHAHNHICLSIYTCPSGQTCFAPHMHPQRVHRAPDPNS